MVFKRRKLWIVMGAGLVMMLAAAGYWMSGSSAVESWVGSQILEMAAGYLEPQLKFERLTFVRPKTIILQNLTLTSPDPAGGGKEIVILSVKRARLELTSVPRWGEAVKFSSVELEDPEVRLVASGANDHGLVGFSHFVKKSGGGGAEHPTVVVTTTQAATTEPATTTTQVATKPKGSVSDFLLIRHVEIKNGAVSFDSRQEGEPVMALDALNMGLDFLPVDGVKGGSLYTLSTTVSRKPAFELGMKGNVDIDTGEAELAKLEIVVDLQEENERFLPAELQNWLRKYEITGQLNVSMAGSVPLTRWQESAAAMHGHLKGAHVAAGQNALAVGTWDWDAEMTKGVATIQRADAHLLGGEVHAVGTIPLDGKQPANLEVNALNLQIEKLLRQTKPDELPKYAGSIKATLNYSAPLKEWNKAAGGGGEFSIRQGRIANIPWLGDIITGMVKVLVKPLKKGNEKEGLTDMADGTFSFAGDKVKLEQFTGTSGTLALRGGGTIGFDKSLDLRINGGPMEGLQNAMGDFGKIWAGMSDAISGYRVNGTLDAPKVTVEIGGK